MLAKTLVTPTPESESFQLQAPRWTPGQEILPYLRHDMDKSQEKDKDPNFRSHRLPVVFLPCRFKVPGMEHMTGLMLLLLLSRFSRVRLCATP